jgi:hypothetical protein
MREGDLIKRTYKMGVTILRTGQRKRPGKSKGKKWVGKGRVNRDLGKDRGKKMTSK